MRTIPEILDTSQVVAVVGLSPKPDRDSYRVAKYLGEQGYTVLPVNPNEEWISGRKCYPDLLAIKEHIDIAVIFRRAELVCPIVEDAARAGVASVWMQLGIVNQDAATIAAGAGMDVVMDKCIMVEHVSHSQK